MELIKKLKNDRFALFCLGFILFIIILGVMAPVLSPYDPTAMDIKNKFSTLSLAHPFGTDKLGRDILSRILYGIQTTFFLSLATMFTTIAIGSALGLLAGFFRGWIDDAIMRICDIMLSFPSEVMILAIVGIMGPGLFNIVIANVIAKWAWYTRMIRGTVIQYRDKNYVRFAKVSGCSTFHIISKHLLPATIGEIVVLASLDAGWVILNISSLSFLGLGVQAPTPEWGMMLSEAKEILTTHPYQMIPAGTVILLVVGAFNFLGDSLRDAFDPKHALKKEGI